jgi:hypothetical protein
LKDLQRFLRRDETENRSAFFKLGELRIVENDIIPLITTYPTKLDLLYHACGLAMLETVAAAATAAATATATATAAATAAAAGRMQLCQLQSNHCSRGSNCPGRQMNNSCQHHIADMLLACV